MPPSQLKFLVVELFHKMDKGESHIQDHNRKGSPFFWKRIMCMFNFPGVIISDNRTKFANTIVVYFYHDLEVQNKFIFVFH